MGLIYLSSIYLSFFLTITFIPKSKSNDLIYLEHYCSARVIFPPNNTYNSTLNTLLQYLSSNASVSPTGFYNTSIYDRTIDNTFYGYFLCRADLDSYECQTCVSTAVTNKSSCPASVWETIFYDKCTIMYSNESLNGVLAMNPAYPQQNPANLFFPGNRNDLVGLFLELVPKAANNNQSGRKYATAVIRLTEVSLYVMAQCKPDLSVNDCQICLRNATESLQIRKGEKYMTPSCNIRYEAQPFFKGAELIPELMLPPPGSVNPGINTNKKKKVSAAKVVVPVLVALAAIIEVVIALRIYLLRKKANKAEYPLLDINDDLATVESLTFKLGTLEVATNNFSDDQKLGQGGFGTVYKGTLSNGQEIAVKRLSKKSVQGVEEFKNEVEFLAKLQHRNLVKLLGFCLDGEEKLLVYEFLPNKSLDYFIFDHEKSKLLDWKKRYDIIGGIARGMLYLHEDSRLKIIHRDLKASNILLDSDMNPKVTDFGTARLFEIDQTQGCTINVAGTLGYMAPEYVLHGQFSVKSDVYSFGILVLEIICGKKIFDFYQENGELDLISFAWKHWRDGTHLEFVDPRIRDQSSIEEVIRCMNLGLLCVQDADQRPFMWTIVLMLNSFSTTIPLPTKPTLIVSTNTHTPMIRETNLSTKYSPTQFSSADVSITMPR